MAWNDNYFSSYIKENPDAPIEAVTPWDYEGVVSLPGHYFNTEDVALRDAFNDCYSDLKTSGRMAEILTEFGFNPDTIPEPGPGYPPGSPEGDLSNSTGRTPLRSPRYGVLPGLRPGTGVR